ncbi:hypothetical protein [Neisseria flavescens]|uniref:hypothetical protein n=1 Tax=Neisseria flavescens TaxID=484 RepID=UPI001241AC78|nr:hypothetical protein [Neisseria flavescens]
MIASCSLRSDQPRAWLRHTASVGRILVSDKTFNIPVVAIHCGNAQNVGFENPTYGKLQTFRRPQTPSENLWHKGRLKKWFQQA